MSPVTENAEQPSPWEGAMQGHLKANKQAGLKPDSWRSLHLALASLDTDGRAEATWKTQVTRWRRGKVRPSEQNAQMVAQALGVPREELPPTERPTVWSLDRHLQEHEERISALEDQNQELEELTARLKIALGQFRRLVDEPHLQDAQQDAEAPPDRPRSGSHGA